MTVEIFLIADNTDDAETLAAQLEGVLARSAASALLIRAGDEDDFAYLARVKPLAKIAQKHDCAVLLDNRPELVRKAYVDGVHMSVSYTHLTLPTILRV